VTRPFLFGVATADHQCEAYDAAREDVRDVWEHVRRLTPRGRATDFWSRWPEDVALARGLGCSAFRFSVAWSRVEPRPGEFDPAALAHYRELAGGIRQAGMEPVLTLHHFTWPVHVEERGGLTADGFCDLFCRYADRVAEALGDLVRYWVTFNEPTGLVFGYLKPWWQQDYSAPPGLAPGATLAQQADAVARLARSLFVSHARARAVIKRHRPDALVSSNPYVLGLPGWLRRLLDLAATRVQGPDAWARQVGRLARRPALPLGPADLVLAGLTQTPGRGRLAAFSEPYYLVRPALLVPAGSPVQAGRDLAGATVAVTRRSVHAGRLPELAPGASARAVRDLAAARSLLDAGRVAAIAADDVQLEGLMRVRPGAYRRLDLGGRPEPYVAAAAHGDPELIAAVDRAVRRFVEGGGWDASHERHLPGWSPAAPPRPGRERHLVSAAAPAAVAGGPAPPDAAAGGALRRARDRGHLVVAVRSDVPGLGYREPGEAPRGLEVDLAQEVARELFGDPDRVRFVTAPPGRRLLQVRGWLGSLLEPLLRRLSVATTALNSNWWHLGMAGRLPAYLCPPECAGQQDFAGIDYYWGVRTLGLHRLQQLQEALAGQYDRAPVWPGALSGMLRRLAKLFPGLPILVVENGCVEQASGVDRATYVRRHVAQVRRALRRGAPVHGYVCWSITSNREWGLPFRGSSDFGLFHVDLDGDPELRRTPTAAAAAYAAEIACPEAVESLEP
jgi:beta-glucosidase/6-phospho-beta-glucosidase/beta-galactosidase/ABC-type amino acid transport substrate-binding protein